MQVCTPANRDYLLSFRPELRLMRAACARASIRPVTSSVPSGREPLTMLFVGSFRHDPNRIAVDWFVREVLPHILEQEPGAKLVIAGSDPPPPHAYADHAANLEMLGYVEDVRDPLARYSVFVCPILSGSGVRVKLLEAFAAGIPVVSTFVGAEGLAGEDGAICALADDAAGFAARALDLLRNPEAAAQMAARARAEVEAQLGYGRDYPKTGGWLSRNSSRRKRGYFPVPRSFLMRLTISEAVRSISFDSDPLGGSYTDHSTWRDFWSTRNTVPLVRPNVESWGRLCALVSVSISGPGLVGSSPFFGGWLRLS